LGEVVAGFSTGLGEAMAGVLGLVATGGLGAVVGFVELGFVAVGLVGLGSASMPVWLTVSGWVESLPTKLLPLPVESSEAYPKSTSVSCNSTASLAASSFCLFCRQRG
jgi:hypothetical protein